MEDTRSTSDFGQDTVVIYHSLNGALFFSFLVVCLIMASLAMFWYLATEISDTFPLLFYLSFAVLFIVALHVSKSLLVDAGKVALTIGPEGVKFDRYQLIGWRDIEEIYVREESEGGDTLWLSVKEGVTFLPDGPRLLLWLAKVSGLHRCIDITGYGRLSMKDEDIHLLIERWLRKIDDPNIV